jgi:hypothetical protein
VAISAATTFERIPPEPERGGLVADRELLQRGEVHDLGHALGGRVAPRVPREQPVGDGQQDEPVGAEEDRDLRGEEVVVAEGDLVGRGRVVLVDDRTMPSRAAAAASGAR